MPIKPAHFCLLPLLALLQTPAYAALDLSFPASPTQRDVPRVGLNMGGWTFYGAEQIMSNVLKNPGFEGRIDRIVLQAREPDLRFVEDDNQWVGSADHFWDGADFEVVTGLGRGLKGKVVESQERGDNDYPQYLLDRVARNVHAGDAIVLTRRETPVKPPNWWVSPPNAAYLSLITGKVRPGSPGKSMLRMAVRPGDRTEIYSFLDSSGAPAGSLMPVNGKWRFSIWLKAVAGKPDLRFSFKRGTFRFFEQTVQVGRDWQQYTVDFTGSELPSTETRESLQVTLSAGGDNAVVALDDLSLGPAVATAFRPEVISMLKRLKPGYLRDWQGQLGDTIANRIAPPWQRQNTRYHWSEDGHYLFGLDEFVELCAQVESMPWVIIPSTVTDRELPALAEFMVRKQRLHRFKRWVLEFGNENWNPLFRPGALVNDATHAERAQRVFSLLQNKLAGQPVQYLINIQPANPGRSGPEAEAARISGAALTTAPYYFREMDTQASDAQILAGLFPQDEKPFLQEFKSLSAKPLWLYEYNLHTDGGNAGFDERTRAITGLASGNSLAARALAFYDNDVTHHAVYSLSQIYGFAREKPVDGSRLVPLWGVTRDFAFPTMRPTGLAIELMNRAIGGDMYRLDCTASASASCQSLISLGFINAAKQVSLVVSNPTGETRNLSIAWPGKTLPARWQTLDASSLWVNNESPVAGRADPVQIASKPLASAGGKLVLQLPPYAVGVISEKP